MSKKENKLVPKLRFPEFTNRIEWKENSINSIGEVITGNTPSKDDGKNWGGDFIWITAQDFKDKYITTSTLKLSEQGKDKSRVLPQNSVLVTCIASIGLNGINKIECATNQQINAIICNSDNYYEFIYYAINYNSNRLKNLAGQTAVPIISKSTFGSFTIYLPQSKDEQHKIANFLSSLDDLINVETQKLNEFKTHKKGLMQQLFPAEREKVPKLRFKEFRNSGEWIAKSLGDISELITKGTTPQKFSTTGVRFIKIEAFKENYIASEKSVFINEDIHNGELKRSILKEHDILFAIAGTIGKVNLVTKNILPANTNQALAIIRLKEKENKNFILYILRSPLMQEYIKKSISVGAQPNLNLEQMGDFSFPYPVNRKEQEKIADCLSSLDDLINEQSEKVESLKLYKKGLMQQLFPNVSNV